MIGTAQIAQRFCRNCGHSWGWLEHRQVGPNLPQRSIRFTCSNCRRNHSKGVVYIYNKTETDQTND